MLSRIVSSLVLLAAPGALAAEAPAYRNPRAPLEARVSDALSRLSLEEKIAFLSGDETGFASKANSRLGIPAIRMTDGPVGVRADRPATAFPSGISMAASFNPELLALVAEAMAAETRALGHDLLLGPCIGISRNPFNGRNFEGMGEDPYLTGQLARGYLQGLAAGKVIPSVKHYALNDQEFKRMTINTIADERTMHEIHLPAFQEAVDAGAWTVMASYNKINGYYASENDYLLNEVLKRRWGFRGIVVSDWGATHSTVAAANNGLDLEMPKGDFFGEALLRAVKEGAVSEAVINDKVSRILRVIFGSGLMEAGPRPEASVVGSEGHLALARRLAQESLVLLKNEGVLPLQAGKLRKLALIGAGAQYPRIGGGGSSSVNPTRRVSPLEAFREQLPGASVRHATGARLRGDFEAVPYTDWELSPGGGEKGIRGEYFNNMNLEGEPALVRVDKSVNFDFGLVPPGPGVRRTKFSVRWTGYFTPAETRDYDFHLITDDGARLLVDGKPVLDKWFNQGTTAYSVRVPLEAGRAHEIRMEYYQDEGGAIAALGFSASRDGLLEEAVALAKSSEAVVIFAGSSNAYEGEGVDRDSMSLPGGQDELIQAVAAANPRTVVVLTSGNPMAMPWLGSVAAVVYAWFPGQEGSAAVADVLLGKANPSGKLPVSFPKRWEDSAAFGHYPEDPGQPDQVTYAEGIYLGYRHFDTRGIEPLFPFGFGLSYSKFSYGALSVRAEKPSAADPVVEVSFNLTNTSALGGAETAQLYVSEESPSVDRPVKELKAFRKVWLEPGETKRITFRLESRAFAFYDVAKLDWRVNPGRFQLRVGGSSRELPLEGAVELLR